ncbi:DctP family TRAP transporter solute-binding subunit [Halobacillus fulvus]|nr:DctP family TRAP transporter solute-binding subunit [Halobacillus fulvus]
MRTFIALTLLIGTGIFTALFFGFDLKEASTTLEHDDEQTGIRDETIITFSHVVAEDTPKGRAARRFASLVEERTDGEIKVEIYSNASLYNDQNEYEALKNGQIQMIAPATSKLTERFPRWQVLDLPYAFPTYEAIQEAYEGTIGETLLKEVEQDQMKGLTFWYNGYKQMTHTNQPLLQTTDFERAHFRVMPSPVLKSQFESLGASASELPFNKTYTNLEVDFVNGQENTLSNIYSKKLYEKQNHLTVSNHGYLGYVVLMNEAFYESLSEEHQVIIEQALTETTDWIRRHSIEMNDAHLRAIKRDNLMDVHYLPNRQKQAWQQRFETVYNEYELMIGHHLMREVKRIQNEYN